MTDIETTLRSALRDTALDSDVDGLTLLIGLERRRRDRIRGRHTAWAAAASCLVVLATVASLRFAVRHAPATERPAAPTACVSITNYHAPAPAVRSPDAFRPDTATTRQATGC